MTMSTNVIRLQWFHILTSFPKRPWALLNKNTEKKLNIGEILIPFLTKLKIMCYRNRISTFKDTKLVPRINTGQCPPKPLVKAWSAMSGFSKDSEAAENVHEDVASSGEVPELLDTCHLGGASLLHKSHSMMKNASRSCLFAKSTNNSRKVFSI